MCGWGLSPWKTMHAKPLIAGLGLSLVQVAVVQWGGACGECMEGGDVIFVQTEL